MLGPTSSILWPAYLEFLSRVLDYKLFAFAAIFTNIQPFSGCPQSKILKRSQYYLHGCFQKRFA